MTDENQEKEDNQNNSDFSRLDNSPLRNYPIEEEFTTPFIRFYTVPEGYEVVNLWLGGKIYTPRPRKGSGLRMMIGLYGIGQSAYVVNTQLQTRDLCMQRVVTKDLIELPEVDASLNFTVENPTKAMTEAEDYRRTVNEISEAQVRATVSDYNLSDLQKLTGTEENLAYYYPQKENESDGDYKKRSEPFPELAKIGVKIDGLYITKINLPDHLETALARKSTAEIEAAAERELADTEVYVAQKAAEAARLYSENPTALEIRRLQTLEDIAKSGKATFFSLPNDVLGLDKLKR